jgi:hypothetical protein
MATLPRLFHRREPADRKGIRERSALVRSAELALPTFPAPISRDEALAALARSRARRAAAASG